MISLKSLSFPSSLLPKDGLSTLLDSCSWPFSNKLNNLKSCPLFSNLILVRNLASNKGSKFDSFSTRKSTDILNRRSVLGSIFQGFTIFTLSGSVMASSPSPSIARAKSSEAEEILKNVEWPLQFPFKDEDFQRYDESEDTFFYSQPRFVTHIDDSAINALTKYYSSAFPKSATPGIQLLDMCSSWISHYPKDYKADKIVGMGLNEDELKKNPIFHEYYVQDLNKNTKLPFEDNTFDVITNTVSVDYLTKPLPIFQEMNRVLKPGGLAIMSFSNRCFWTKAISIWTQTGDIDHTYIVGSYFHYAGGYEPPKALDISPNPGRTDPMFVVYSRKLVA